MTHPSPSTNDRSQSTTMDSALRKPVARTIRRDADGSREYVIYTPSASFFGLASQGDPKRNGA